jgi:hypothetical protein
VIRDRSGYFLPLVRIEAIHALARRGAMTHEAALDLLRSEPDAAVRAALERVAGGNVHA